MSEQKCAVSGLPAGHIDACHDCDPCIYAETIGAVAMTHSQQEDARGGFVMAPAKCTQEMSFAIHEAVEQYIGRQIDVTFAPVAWAAGISAAPPAPAGDVGELPRLIEQLGDIPAIDPYRTVIAVDPGFYCLLHEDLKNEILGAMERANSRTPLPAWPHSLHALEHNTAADPNGLVMYFNTPQEADAFCRWLTDIAVAG